MEELRSKDMKGTNIKQLECPDLHTARLIASRELYDTELAGTHSPTDVFAAFCADRKRIWIKAGADTHEPYDKQPGTLFLVRLPSINAPAPEASPYSSAYLYPLPPGWDASFDPTRERAFYINSVSGHAQWERPQFAAGELPSAQPAKAAPRGARGSAAAGARGSAAAGAMNETLHAAAERGEKLERLDDRSRQLADGAADFASMATQLRQAEQKRSWW